MAPILPRYCQLVPFCIPSTLNSCDFEELFYCPTLTCVSSLPDQPIKFPVTVFPLGRMWSVPCQLFITQESWAKPQAG